MSDEQHPERPKGRPARNPITPKGSPITVSAMLERMLPPNPGYLRDIELAQSEDLLGR